MYDWAHSLDGGLIKEQIASGFRHRVVCNVQVRTEYVFVYVCIVCTCIVHTDTYL